MLHVWLRAQYSPLAVWHGDTKQWHAVDSWQQLSNIYGSKSSNKTLCLYFPSSYILQVNTELSSAQLKQLGVVGKQYLFEETSLTPVEQLSVRQVSQGSHHHLHALAKSDIEAWQQSAALVGMRINALLPDYLLLPVLEEGAGQQVTLYQDRYTMLMRQSLRLGMAVSYLPLMLEHLPHLSEVSIVPTIDSTHTEADDDAVLNNTELSDAVLNEGISLQKESIDPNEQTAAYIAEQQILLTTAHPLIPADHPERHELNFAIRLNDAKLAPYLRVAMMVALSALVLQMATDGAQWYRYNQATAATQTAIAAQYQSWFADERLNSRTQLRTQMSPKLRTDAQGQTPHMAALSRISPLIKQSSLQAKALVMAPSSLSFTLIASERNSLDQFTSTLIEQGLSASLERVNANEQGQFSGQITIDVMEAAP
ncbi:MULTISPECIES: type II secretion system protein GspL [unclassified Psychrobacter]|uniref:type II secretion system protein GspL n=1 Tax=unclassified Psychrobacter TaxID=196806 RepID=UPI003FD10509